jgi:hypothetical protein
MRFEKITQNQRNIKLQTQPQNMNNSVGFGQQEKEGSA